MNFEWRNKNKKRNKYKLTILIISLRYEVVIRKYLVIKIIVGIELNFVKLYLYENLQGSKRYIEGTSNDERAKLLNNMDIIDFEKQYYKFLMNNEAYNQLHSCKLMLERKNILKLTLSNEGDMPFRNM